MNIKQAIEKGAVNLKTANIESPKVKARMLMQFILNKPRQYIIINDMKELTLSQKEEYFEYIKKLMNNMPIEHITKQKEFMKMNFFVNEKVLIPRQDTEVLVEEVIKIAKKTNSRQILDLCTGSGAIAVSLAKYLPNVEITATDISLDAIKIATKNAIMNNVENKITFVHSNLFQNILKDRYDIIVSNPPYIKSKEIGILDKQIQKEPRIALDGGIDGLDFYRKIIKQCYEYLRYEGFLCLEIGYDQKIDVIELLENEEKFGNIYSKKDLYGNDRIVIGQIKFS